MFCCRLRLVVCVLAWMCFQLDLRTTTGVEGSDSAEGTRQTDLQTDQGRSFEEPIVSDTVVQRENTAVGQTEPGQAENGQDADANQDSDEKVDREYFELFKLFADTIDQIERNYVKPVDRRELMEAAIRGLTTKLDPYSNYIPPDQMDHFRSSIDSEFGGIGIQVSLEHGRLMIISPLVGTPAYRGGLMSGDHVISIEGETTEGISLDEAVRRMKGKVGTEVTLTVNHTDGEEQTITLKREMIRIETVLGDTRNSDDQWNFLLEGEDKLGYIRLTAFGRHTARELRSSLEELRAQGCRGMVLDLRYNPGGLLSSAVEVSDMFVASGVIVSTEGRNTPKRAWKAHQSGTFEGLSVGILVNNFSASASEIVAACLQDHGRAVVIGERTWGKGSVQNVVELEEGKSLLKLTTASYQRPSGKNIHRFYGASQDDEWGVHPDDGFLVDWDSKQNRAYLEYRRNRDIVLVQHDSPDDDSTTDSTTAVETTDPGDTGPETSAEPTDNSPDASGSEGQPGDQSETPAKVQQASEDVFVDTQLQLALKYLREDLDTAEQN